MSNLTLIIGNKNYSSWSLRPWIFMRHFQLDFKEKRIPLFTQATDEALAPYFSDSKVPVLIDDDLIVWDSLSILEYLSDAHLDSSGWPANQQARAFARSITAEMHSSFANIRNELPMNCRKQFSDIKLSENAEKEKARIENIWQRCRSEFGEQGDWLFGDFSIADAMYAPITLRFSGYNISLSDPASQYVQTMLRHPDIAQWIEAGKQETETIEMDEI